MSRTLYWDKHAVQSFARELMRIRKKSSQRAVQVEDELLSMIDQLLFRPGMHLPDKFKRNNKGEFRLFELHRLRVSYFVDESAIIILRVLHWRRQAR